MTTMAGKADNRHGQWLLFGCHETGFVTTAPTPTRHHSGMVIQGTQPLKAQREAA